MIEFFSIRNKKTRILLILILLVVLIYLFNKKENYSGALIQLYSKGPQDYYLTGDYPYYYQYYYPYIYGYRHRRYYPNSYPYIWNMPTRFRRNDAPYLLLTPDRDLYY